MTLYKKVNGQDVELTADEISEYNANVLQGVISEKLTALDIYHFSSPELRLLTINGTITLSLTKAGRDLILEQLNKLDNKVLMGLSPQDAKFIYIHEGIINEIDLEDLRSLSVAMMDIVDTNWVVYDNHIVNIKNLTTPNDVEEYDFTLNYLKNQNINI